MDTPVVEKSKLDEDKEGKIVDPSHYRGMIGTLLYLTASRPDSTNYHPIACVPVLGPAYRKAVTCGTMDTTRAEQIALDDDFVAPANRLKIGKSNFRLRSDLKSKEATLQVVYDVLKLTPFYKAFQISADVPKIYMQEFWATATVHHHSIRFKMNNKKHIVNLEYFREMHQICPKLPNQQFEELPFEEAILTFLRDLGHSGEIKMITDVNVNKLHQPWRSFAAGMYHKKNIDYAYLLWEDFVYQVENKNVKKSNEMYYPRFTKVIVNFFITKDQSIPRRNNVNWQYARDDYMFTTIKVVSRHEDTQLYGVILPNELTNEDIRNSESYKEYYVIALGVKPPKMKASVKKKQIGYDKTTTSSTTKGKRLKTSAKIAKPAKKKQPAKTSMDKGADEGTGSIPGVPDVPTYESDEEQISWKSSEEDNDDEVNVSEDDDTDNDDDVDKNDEDDDTDNQDDENPNDANQDDKDEQTDSDNNGDDFVHPKLSIHDDEATQDDEVNEEENDDESNEDSDEEVQGANIEEDEMDEKATHEEDEANELYRDVNVNLEGRDTKMTDAPLPNVLGTQVTEDTHVIITAPVNPEGLQQSSSSSSGFISNMLNPSPDTGIDIIFTLNTETTSPVDVLVTTIAETPLLSATTLPPTPLITHLQQTPFKQTNQFAEAVSSILGIIDAYLANKMHEAVKTVVQLQSERLKDEAQAKNADFLNKLDDNIKKIIKDQVKEQVKAQVSKILPKIEKTVNEQLEAEVMTRSSTESKTSLAIAANLSELELKKILIDKMESNKSIHRSDEQKNLYKALVDAYESDKLILDTYGDTVSFKRRRDDEDKDEEPSPLGSKKSEMEKSNEGSKSLHKSASRSTHVEEPMHTTKDLEEPAHQEFKTGATEDQPVDETPQPSDWFHKPTRLPSHGRDWNKTLPTDHGPVQPYIYILVIRGELLLWKEVYKWKPWIHTAIGKPEGNKYPHDLRGKANYHWIPNSPRSFSYKFLITSSTTTLHIYLVVYQSEHMQLLLRRSRLQIMGICSCDVLLQKFRNYCYSPKLIDLFRMEWLQTFGSLDHVSRSDDKLYTFKEGSTSRGSRIQGTSKRYADPSCFKASWDKSKC
ncbi:hypothetical protein Tco_0409931 [Tanacetum coccineum]